MRRGKKNKTGEGAHKPWSPQGLVSMNRDELKNCSVNCD